MWKKPAAKSIRLVSVEMWLTSLPLGISPLDFWENWRARSKMAEISPARDRTPVPILPEDDVSASIPSVFVSSDSSEDVQALTDEEVVDRERRDDQEDPKTKSVTDT